MLQLDEAGGALLLGLAVDGLERVSREAPESPTGDFRAACLYLVQRSDLSIPPEDVS